MGIMNWMFGKQGDGPKGRGQNESAPPPAPPPARRVAARAIVLATIVCRAFLDRQREEIENPEDLRGNLLAWLEGLAVSGELEPSEREFLQGRVGQTEEKDVVNASWRGEGLAVLAWALNRFELPAYDQSVFPPDPAQESVGFGNSYAATELLGSAVLRPPLEISRFASHVTIVQWRLRQFQLSRNSAAYRAAVGALQPWGHGVAERMDFTGYLSVHPAFKDYWLDGLRLVDGDLAIGEKSIVDAPEDEVQRCTSIALERQIAAFWLRGDNPIYSTVDPATILMAC
jgi:hypothetical protein